MHQNLGDVDVDPSLAFFVAKRGGRDGRRQGLSGRHRSRRRLRPRRLLTEVEGCSSLDAIRNVATATMTGPLRRRRIAPLETREADRLAEDYPTLVAHKPDFKAHLLGGPKVDDFTIERDRDTGRPIEL